MRLHHLEIRAFGSFPGTERIDFDALADSGLFLLSGPTGAGKTTILDAICFALYNEVPGARKGRTEELRSHHAASDTLTTTILEATLGGRRLRITRAPAQERPKRVGEGTTRQPATVNVEELVDGDWVSRATKQEEATSLVTELLGLNASQFQQVVLLPQGQFAEFLRASSTQRLPLLQALFDTTRFVSIENWLRDEESRAGRAAAKINQAMDLEVQHLSEQLAVDPPDPADRNEWLDELKRTYAADKAAADGAVTRAEAAQALANDLAAAQKALADDQETFRTAAQRKQELDDLAPEHDATQARLAAARKAVGVRTLLESCDRHSTALEQAEEALLKATSQLDALRPGLSSTSDDDLTIERDRITQVLAELKTALKVERTTLPDAIAEAARLEGELHRIDDELTSLTAKLDQHDTSLKEDERAKAQGAQAQRQQAIAVERSSQAKEALGRAKDRADLLDKRAKAETRLGTAQEQLDAARRKKVEVLTRRRAGLAAELAGELEPGDPCPVCGSAEHPHPAEPTDAHASQAELDAADAALNASTAEFSAAETLLDTLTDRITKLNEALSHKSLEEIEEAATTAAAEEEAFAAAIAAGDEAATRLEGAEQARQELTSRQREVEQSRPKKGADLQTVTNRVVDLRKIVSDAVDGFPTLDAHRSHLDGLRDAVAMLLAQRSAKNIEAKQLAIAREAARTEATRSGFDGLDDAAAAVLPPEDVDALNAAVKKIDDERSRVEAILDSERLQEANAAAPADQVAAEARATEAKQTYNDAVGESQRIKGLCEAIAHCRKQLVRKSEEGGPIADRHRVLRTLSDLARGEKGGLIPNQRMRLTSYVLSARLQLVADAASKRLHHMSQGRYALRQTDEALTGQQAGGLGLEVIDTYANSTRSTNSLSGGESFAASLALALGLADIVAAEAGGSSLETLFIDEGFGSLDEESLNSVLDILDDLRSGGRTIGVVSHVAEMKERIPVHLTVHKSDRGSRITQ
jgi:exonuclease SbcC